MVFPLVGACDDSLLATNIQRRGHQPFWKRATSCVPSNAKAYYSSLIHTSEIQILLDLPLLILVLIFVNVKTLIMLMLFLEQACGDLHVLCGRPGARMYHVGDPW